MKNKSKNAILIKVCGMREPQNIADVTHLGIDYVGFIFYEKSPRYILPIDIEQLPHLGKVQKVGVFVNHAIDFIVEKIHNFQLDLVQLHGDESVRFCTDLRAAIHLGNHKEQTHQVKIIKVFSVGEAFDFSGLNDYKPIVDYFLFDTKGKNLGGNGTAFNWDILKNYDNEVPFFLSGGIDNQHIEEIKALNNLNIHAIDINSKFEISAGNKDIGKLKNFILAFEQK